MTRVHDSDGQGSPRAHRCLRLGESARVEDNDGLVPHGGRIGFRGSRERSTEASGQPLTGALAQRAHDVDVASSLEEGVEGIGDRMIDCEDFLHWPPAL